jgi:hypothetical protein
MSEEIESRTFLWSSASFKIIKIGIKLTLVRRFEMNKTHHCVHFRISAPLSKIVHNQIQQRKLLKHAILHRSKPSDLFLICVEDKELLPRKHLHQ